MKEVSLACLRPEQICKRISRMPVAFIPIGPMEWHGPHCPYGTDGLNAQHVAAEVCRGLGGVLWPTLFWGTERERPPSELENLGFPDNQRIVGMDFPAHAPLSCYCSEDVLGILVRDVVRQAGGSGRVSWSSSKATPPVTISSCFKGWPSRSAIRPGHGCTCASPGHRRRFGPGPWATLTPTRPAS